MNERRIIEPHTEQFCRPIVAAFVGAYYASYIARAIFPASNEFASLMLTLGTFGAGYLMRPLGAIVLGAYMDRHGRRKGLILGISLMAVGTFSNFSAL